MTGGGIDVRISNLGGITSAELRLEPGVNVLTGANGAGKTSAIGLYVLTERPTEGHLRVDHVRGEEAW